MISMFRQWPLLAALGFLLIAAPAPAAQAKQCKATEELGSGKASWYGPGFHGRKTANGEIFNMNAMTAAHKTLPLGTWLEVENKKNGEFLLVRINDRGPYIKGRVLDLSREAAVKLGLEHQGVGEVTMRRCLL
ncbi:MAG: septal ring lytic transglycosylase RlpA family protein [Micavibrio sp.]